MLGIPAKEAERFIKFVLVGTIGFVVHFSTLTFLKEVVGVENTVVVANPIAFFMAVCSNFLLNRFWTYTDSRSKNIGSQFVQFLGINVVGLLINSAILAATERPFTTLLASSTLPIKGYQLALILATVIVLFWNFFVNRYVTYSDVS